MKVYIVNHETLDFFPHLEGYWQCTPIAMDFSFSRLRSASFDLFNELLRDFLIVTQGKEIFNERIRHRGDKKKNKQKKNVGKAKSVESRKVTRKLEVSQSNRAKRKLTVGLPQRREKSRGEN